MKLPTDHIKRFELNNEVHARPPEPIVTPSRVSYIALVADPSSKERETRHIAALCQRFGVGAPSLDATHFTADLGPFRLRWERHTEFSRYMFLARGAVEDPFATAVMSTLPAEWLRDMPGETMVAAHAAVISGATAEIDHDAISKRMFAGNMLIGSTIADGRAVALTDLRIHPDGMSRFLVIDNGLTPNAVGRMVQRLLELETYRMMALLALPVARQMTPFIAECERELSHVTSEMIDIGEAQEPLLLDRLTKLESAIESRYADTQYRFAAAEAYHELVKSRIDELRETRIEGLQTFKEFTERRLTPAMSTCRSVADRVEAVSERVARSTQLLSTRVGITREQQNQLLLETMSRRASMQLRLQQTVEGLSIAAITYYIVGLVGYAAKGFRALGINMNADFVMGISIPIVIAMVTYGLRQYRRKLAKGAEPDGL